MSHLKTCGRCEHFQKLGTEPRGYCFGSPPTVFASGVKARPEVKENEKACGIFKELPEGIQPDEKHKADPETPGDAGKAARAETTGTKTGSGSGRKKL